jgi:hypothetical protein
MDFQTVKDIMQQNQLENKERVRNKHEAPDKQSPSFLPSPAPFSPILSLGRIIICNTKKDP